jgi:hypothetical protein
MITVLAKGVEKANNIILHTPTMNTKVTLLLTSLGIVIAITSAPDLAMRRIQSSNDHRPHIRPGSVWIIVDSVDNCRS